MVGLPPNRPAKSPPLLSNELAESAKQLSIVARRTALGALAGIHRSPRSGSSIEFSEHRRYVPGDDIRRIDWKVFAKTERVHVKNFEDENTLSVMLLLDHSASMGFSSGAHSKFELSRILAAALSYIALHQRDAVGLLSFNHKITHYLPPRSSANQFHTIVRTLSNLAPQAHTHFKHSFADMAARLPSHSVCFVLSDFLGHGHEDFTPLLRSCGQRKTDMAIIHALDHAELTFPYEEPTLFVGMEAQSELFADPKSIKNAYQAEIQEYLTRLKRAAGNSGSTYYLVDSRLPPKETLIAILQQRLHLIGTGERAL